MANLQILALALAATGVDGEKGCTMVCALSAGAQPGKRWLIRRSRPQVGFASLEVTLPWLATSIGWGPNGVFAAIVISESALTVLGVIVFRRGKWRLQEV